MDKYVPESVEKKSAQMELNGKLGCSGSQGGGAGLDGATYVQCWHAALNWAISSLMPGQKIDAAALAYI